MRLYESNYFRVDQIAPTPSAEDAVVTGAFDFVMLFVGGGNA